MSPLRDIFVEFFKLGLTSFGGPSAHIAYFRERFVEKKNWLDESEFAALLALTQFLPGPGSSQLGMAIGWKKGGVPGSLAAFLGFTLPSAVLMILFALGVMKFGSLTDGEAGWIRGLQIAVVVVIANAVWSMAKTLCVGKTRSLIAISTAAIVLSVDSVWTQVGVICFGVVAGSVLLRNEPDSTGYNARLNRVQSETQQGTVGFSVFCLVAFTMILLAIPWLVNSGNELIRAFAGMYKSGALVFGGGHVVLPLLSRETVDAGWLGAPEFAAGYGAAQAVPGPLFTISSYLGAVLKNPAGPWVAGLVCTIGIFLPGWLLTLGTLPFRERMKNVRALQKALAGANAAVVGLLGAALYDPVWLRSIRNAEDVVFLLGVSALLLVFKLPPWLVVITAGVVGGFLY
ncbi:MAG: chromate efflux transporter [Verrucomicrobiales bacterium]|nr:chromate efflux transporter [Verrucomicrobiales bacterium]